jgi:cob(I)alamin adenosyltransferase
MKVYTKTGDKGSSGLIGGVRVPKDDLHLEAFGTIDELNSHLALLMAYLPSNLSCEMIQKTQHLLFEIGASLATTTEARKQYAPQLTEVQVTLLENEIDVMENELTALTHFILPPPHLAIAQAHVCRTVCRRAERAIVALTHTEPIHEWILPFINRLSDYLFVYSRYIALKTNTPEVKWIPGK